MYEDNYTYGFNPSSIIWITVLTPLYTGPLLEDLLKQGFVVSAAKTGCTTLTYENGISSVIGIKVEHDIHLPANELMESVRESLFKIKACYYSIVLSGTNGSSWSAGNIVFGGDKVAPPPKKKNHLKLVDNKSE